MGYGACVVPPCGGCPEGACSPDRGGPMYLTSLQFSKFIHGCATLMPNRVDLVPFWLPQSMLRVSHAVESTANVGRAYSGG